MQLFQGRWRKAALFPLSTLMLGWLVYLVGFILLMVKGDTSTHPRFDHLPHYTAVAAPPVLVALAGFHAALFGLVSSILGLFAAVLSVVCFSGTGYVLYTYAVSLYHYLHFNKDEGVDVKCVLMLTGTLLSMFSWMSVLVMWHYFTYKPRWGALHSLDDVVDEDGTTTPPPPLPREPRLFAGVARKVAAVLLILKTVSWCVLVRGIDGQVSVGSNSSVTYMLLRGAELGNSSAYVDELGLSFGTWTVCVIGILLVLSATLHAASNGDSSSLMGAFTSVIGQLFITCLGYMVFAISIDIYHMCQDRYECTISTVSTYRLYQLCGAVGSGILWACVLALWPFYFKPVENLQGQRRSVQNQREYYFRDQNREHVPLLYQSNEYRSPTPTPSAPPL